jgi:hypothetical protein
MQKCGAMLVVDSVVRASDNEDLKHTIDDSYQMLRDVGRVIVVLTHADVSPMSTCPVSPLDGS